MTEHLVSIIIPAFNAEQHVRTSIYSALGQSHHGVEVIVVDDGSTDRTAAVVREVRDARVALVQQDNCGQSSAVNRGVAMSSGAYIKLLDADDWLNPEHVAAQLRVIEGRPDSLGSCRWGYFVADPACANVQSEAVHCDYDDPLEWLVDSLTLDEGMMGGWMWLIPRSVWNRAGGYDPRLSLNNDFHFSIKLLLASEGVRFASEAVYSYRKGMSGALSGSSGQRAMESAYLTTELGTRLLLQREDSPRIRRICADRFQQWLFKFYPEYPELSQRAESRIAALGGSDRKLEGGMLLNILQPLLGWKAVRRLQSAAYRYGWEVVLHMKAEQRRRALE